MSGADASVNMGDFIDMTTPATAAIPRYDGILKGAGELRKEAASCDRCGTILAIAGVLAAVAGWTWSVWSLVRMKQGYPTFATPVTIVETTLGSFGVFLMALCFFTNAKRNGVKLRLAADLAAAQRDVAINSHVAPVAHVRPTRPTMPVAKTETRRVRPATPMMKVA
jgi:hypothetical protein